MHAHMHTECETNIIVSMQLWDAFSELIVEHVERILVALIPTVVEELLHSDLIAFSFFADVRGFQHLASRERITTSM
jgi:hypothetical protein